MDVMGGCEVCGSALNLQRCSQCKTAVYCSREHQIADWPTHKIRCLQRIQLSNSNQLRATHPTNCTFIPQLLFGSEASTQQQQPANVDHSFKANTVNFDLSSVATESSTFNLNCQILNDSSESDLPDDYLQFLRNQTNCEESPLESSSANNTQISVADLQLSTLSWSDRHNSENYLPSSAYSNSIVQQLSHQSRLVDNQQLATINYTQSPFEDFSCTVYTQPTASTALQMEQRKKLKTSDFNSSTCQNGNERDNVRVTHSGNVRINSVFNDSVNSNGICVQVINDMEKYGICVIDDFLGKVKASKILTEVVAMHKGGLFRPGQVVNPSLNNGQVVRGDRIRWLYGNESGAENIGHLIQYVDSIIKKCNVSSKNGKLGNYKISYRTQAMIACYPGGGTRYVKHVDNPNKDGRCITSIYYLNENWNSERDGGMLRIFPQDCAQRIAVIAPLFDRILFFWSDRRNPHEVQPANRTRYAITLWYNDDIEKAAMQNKSESKETQRSPGVSPEI